MESAVFCYCGRAFRESDLQGHMSSCASRRDQSPIYELVQRLIEEADREQRLLLLEELRLELSQLPAAVVPPAPQANFRPEAVSMIPPNHGNEFARSAHRSSTTPPETRIDIVGKCGVCNNELTKVTGFQPQCQHWQCRIHFEVGFEDNYLKSGGYVGCKTPGCSEILQWADLTKLRDDETMRRLHRQLKK